MNAPTPVEIPEDEEPQTCFTSCNLRSCVFAIAVINILTSALSIIGYSVIIIRMVHGNEIEYRYMCLLASVPVFNIGLFIMNVRLFSGVWKRDIHNIRLWLRVYTALFYGFALTVMLYCTNGSVSAAKKYAGAYFHERDFNDAMRSIAACGFWYAGTCYAVYQYYSFERTRAQQNIILERQNHFRMTEHTEQTEQTEQTTVEP